MMSSLLLAFQQILPVFFLMAVGYALRWTRFMNDEFIKDLSSFVFYVLVPPLMFLSIAESDLGKSFAPEVIFPTLAGLVIFSTAIYFLSGTRLSPSYRGVFTQGASRSNLVLVGLPILMSLFGDSILGKAALFICFHALLNNLLGVLFLLLPHHSLTKGSSWQKMALQIVINPIIIGCVLGIAFSSTGFALPGIVHKTLQGLSNATIPLALLIVGASLQRSPLGGQILVVGLACLLKLIVLPGLIWGLLAWLGVSGRLVLMSVLLLGAPTAAVSQIMAKEMKGDETLASAVVMATTLLSPFTLTAWITLLS